MSRMSAEARIERRPVYAAAEAIIERYSIVSTTPLRADTADTARKTPSTTLLPPPLVEMAARHRIFFSTWLGKLSRVAVSSARPRRTGDRGTKRGMTE